MAKYPRLTKRGAVYWFRAKVPANLLSTYAPKREVVFSLKTKDYREAVERARIESVKIDQEFAAAAGRLAAPSRTTLSGTEVERLAAMHYHMRLEEDDEFRAFGTRDQPLLHNVSRQLNVNPNWQPHEIVAELGLSDREFQKSLESTDIVLSAQRSNLAKGDTSLVLDAIEDLLEQNALQLDPNSDEYRILSLAILKADVKASEAIQLRNQGRIVDTPAPPEPLFILNSTTANDMPTLSQALAEWEAQHNGPQKTAHAFRVAVGRFTSLLGDKAVSAISKADIRAFRDAMLRFPVLLTVEQRKMSVPELLRSTEGRDELKRLSPKTVNEKYLAAISAILSLCMNEAGYIEVNPCNGIRAKAESSVKPPRLLYTDDDVAIIMSFPIFTQGERPKGGAGEASKWLPLLGLFTGARLEELARLTVGDIHVEEGILYLFIRPGLNGKRVKSRSSIRKVPIHSKLVNLGFIDYINTIDHQTDLLIFPLLKSAVEQASSSWSKWWGRYARQNGMDKSKVFHSFRHTVKRKLRDAKVDKTIRDALLGHAINDVAEAYGLDQDGIGISLPILAEAIERIGYPCFENGL